MWYNKMNWEGVPEPRACIPTPIKLMRENRLNSHRTARTTAGLAARPSELRPKSQSHPLHTHREHTQMGPTSHAFVEGVLLQDAAALGEARRTERGEEHAGGHSSEECSPFRCLCAKSTRGILLPKKEINWLEEMEGGGYAMPDSPQMTSSKVYDSTTTKLK